LREEEVGAKSADLKIAPWSKKSVARWLCGGREDAVEAKVHGLRGVVIGPGAGEDEHDAGAGEGTIGEKRNGIGEMRVVNFG